VGGKVVEPNLKYCHGNCPGRLWKTVKNIKLVGVPDEIYNGHLRIQTENVTTAPTFSVY
jgi:hypothetical protein